MDELDSFLSREATTPPSTTLISLLRVYGVDVTKEDELREFAQTQRRLLIQLTPQTNARPKPKP